MLILESVHLIRQRRLSMLLPLRASRGRWGCFFSFFFRVNAQVKDVVNQQTLLGGFLFFPPIGPNGLPSTSRSIFIHIWACPTGRGSFGTVPSRIMKYHPGSTSVFRPQVLIREVAEGYTWVQPQSRREPPGSPRSASVFVAL
jgi:hypothetical protein